MSFQLNPDVKSLRNSSQDWKRWHKSCSWQRSHWAWLGKLTEDLLWARKAAGYKDRCVHFYWKCWNKGKSFEIDQDTANPTRSARSCGYRRHPVSLWSLTVPITPAQLISTVNAKHFTGGGPSPPFSLNE